MKQRIYDVVFTLIIVASIFASWRVYNTSYWLQDLKKYMDVVKEEHIIILNAQKQIIDNQKLILEKLSK